MKGIGGLAKSRSPDIEAVTGWIKARRPENRLALGVYRMTSAPSVSPEARRQATVRTVLRLTQRVM